MFTYKWNILYSIIFALTGTDLTLKLVLGQMTLSVYVLRVFWFKKPISLKVAVHILSIFSVSDYPWMLKLAIIPK